MLRFPALLLLAMLSLARAAPAAPLLVAVEDAAAPWSEKDGTGYANEIVVAAFKAVGVEAKLRVLPYARCKLLVLQGKVAGCFSMSPEPGHEKTLSLSEEPLFTLSVDYFQNSQHPLKATELAKLPRGTVVGIVIGYEYPPSVAEAKARGVIFEEAKDEDSNLKKLKAGRIDAAILNHNEVKPAAELIRAAGITSGIDLAFHGGEMKSYIGFSKTLPEGVIAEKKFNEGFRKISENGTLARIRAKWLPRKP